MPFCDVVLLRMIADADAPEFGIVKKTAYAVSPDTVGGKHPWGPFFLQSGTFPCTEFCPPGSVLVAQWIAGVTALNEHGNECSLDRVPLGRWSAEVSGGTPCKWTKEHVSVPPGIGEPGPGPGIAFAGITPIPGPTPEPGGLRGITTVEVLAEVNGSCSIRAQYVSDDLRITTGTSEVCGDDPERLSLLSSTPPFDLPATACCGDGEMAPGWALRIHRWIPAVEGSGENPLKGYKLVAVNACAGAAGTTCPADCSMADPCGVDCPHCKADFWRALPGSNFFWAGILNVPVTLDTITCIGGDIAKYAGSAGGYTVQCYYNSGTSGFIEGPVTVFPGAFFMQAGNAQGTVYAVWLNAGDGCKPPFVYPRIWDTQTADTVETTGDSPHPARIQLACVDTFGCDDVIGAGSCLVQIVQGNTPIPCSPVAGLGPWPFVGLGPGGGFDQRFFDTGIPNLLVMIGINGVGGECEVFFDQSFAQFDDELEFRTVNPPGAQFPPCPSAVAVTGTITDNVLEVPLQVCCDTLQGVSYRSPSDGWLLRMTFPV